jgi:3-hydroxyacyl-[acyl-carrier-protein] dehydratase
MARPLIDLSSLDVSEDVVPEREVRRVIPHTDEFRMIDGICFLDLERQIVAGYKIWDDNPWWARAHIPGRPMMPGVLMIEGCAQVSAILVDRNGIFPDKSFVALAGVDDTRMRRVITPPAKVFFAATLLKQNAHIARFAAQCLVDGEVALEAELLGVPL